MKTIQIFRICILPIPFILVVCEKYETVAPELKDLYNLKAEWNVTAVPVIRRIVIDSSHNGDVWWYPQSEITGFDPDKYHQVMNFADLLREKRFKVD